MADKKIYTIEINGVKESANAVESLNKQLNELENRIKKLENSSVKVNATSSGGGSRSTSAMDEEAKLAKQIEQIDAKREAYSKEIYQNYLAAKDVLDETVKDQKQIAASERLQAHNYTNTMAGLKQELADIKTTINTTDLGDEAFGKMTQRANEITTKLKELEATMGQFGRDVGNYESAFDGLKKVKVEVGAITREFDNTTKASRTLNQELRALEVNGKGNTQQAKNLREAINNLDSAMKDATVSSRAMDNAMDFMQSFTAMASIGNGLQAFFGFDDNEITKSIQKLVALQGVLNGLENIRKQMETGEGIGSILGRGFKDVDKWTYSLMRANVALRGTGTSARIAAAGIKVLNYAVKGLMTLGLAVALDLIVEGFQKLVGVVKDWTKGDADLVNASDAIKVSIEAQNKVLEQNLELIKKANDAGMINDLQAKAMYELEYARSLKETNKALKEREGLIREQGIKGNSELNLQSSMGDKGVTWIGGFKDAIKSIDDLNKRWDYLNSKLGETTNLWDAFWKGQKYTSDDVKDEFNHINKLIANDFINAFYKLADGTREGTKALVDYINHMDKLTNGRYSKAMKLVKVDNEDLQTQLDQAWSQIETLRDKLLKNPIVVKMELDAAIEAELDKLDPTRAMQRNIDNWTQTLVFGVDDSGRKLTEAERKNIEKIIAEQKKNLAKQQKQRLDSEKSAAQKLKDEAERVNRELAQLRIDNMKEGLEKTLEQLREERRVRLYEAQKTGIRVAEQETLIKELYRKKEIEAVKAHNEEVAKLNHDMWEQIYRSQDQSMRMHLDSELTQYETELKKLEQASTEIFSSRYASYGGTQLPNNMSDDLRRGLGFDLRAKKQEPFNEDTIRMAKEYLDLLERVEETKFYFSKEGSVEYEVAKKALEDWLGENEVTAEAMEDLWATQELKNESYTKSLSTAYRIRINEASAYYNQIADLEKGYYEKVKNNDKELLTKETATAKREEDDRYAQQLAQLEENREKGLVTEERYNELLENMQDAHEKAILAIQERYNSESERIEQDHQDNLKRVTAEGMRGMLNEYRDAYDNISKLQSYQPQKMGGTLGKMGIIDLGVSKKNYKEALDSYKQLSRDILLEKQNLQEKLDANEISFDDFQQAKRELDGLEQDVVNGAQSIQEKLEDLGGEWWGSINEWIQQASQVVNQVMQAIWNAQDAAYEKEQEKLKDQIKFQEDIYNKQKQLAEDHKNAINDIENELSTARGDRRQHLIDQLNAEIEAQRRAVQEQKKAEKEKEKLEKKAEKERVEQKNREKKRAIVQASINTALSISAAAVNSWPVPAVAMMAMAAAMGAAQIAAIASQKYAKGGLLEGKSHRQGGIPVGNTGIEVEGKEYIVRKSSTTPNIELLDYINKSQRKLSLDDFIDFYSSGKARSTFANSTRKFEDGGVLPTLRSDIDVPSRLISTMEDYANRPYVVQVVDIMDKTSQVKQVQAMAGIEG